MIWHDHWFNPSPFGESTGTSCRDCYGWRDDPRHRYGVPPNLAAYVVAEQPGVGLVTIQGKRRGDPKPSGRRAVQPSRLARPAPAEDLAARASARARQILAEYAETVASHPSSDTRQEPEPVAEKPPEWALVF